MRLIIKPYEQSITLAFEAATYKHVWHQNARKLRKAFRGITNLDFQQSTITAYVYHGETGYSGYYRQPMYLPAFSQHPEKKLFILVHELSHRLLGGYQLGNNQDLGLTKLEEHKRTFLFQFDVMDKVLGVETGERFHRFERNSDDPAYQEAYQWVIGMSFTQRQRKMQHLVQHQKF